jgi:osmotically-inducible protein OsmY
MSNLRFTLLPWAALVIGLAVTSSPARARQDAQQPPADNTKKNQDQTSPTADQQKINPSDRTITQKIRKSILADKNLSTYAHNVKVVTEGGKVTLRGPVRSEEEKTNLGAKAAAVVGQDNVTNQIEIAPSK